MYRRVLHLRSRLAGRHQGQRREHLRRQGRDKTEDFVRVLHLWRIGITLVHIADLYHNGAHHRVVPMTV
jgi:hypothetical protein